MKIKTVTYSSGQREVPRGGLFGWLVDLIVGQRYVTTGPALFVAVTEDGGIVTSPDGIIWTVRTTP